GQAIPLEWRKYSGTFAVPPTANFCVVGFRIDGGGIPPHSVVIDNVLITDNSTVPPTVIPVPNPSYEDWPGIDTSAPTDWRFFHVGAATGNILRVENPPAAADATQILTPIFKRDAVGTATSPD